MPTILLVDSDTLVRTQVAQYLRECGYRVLEATRGEEAVVALDGSNNLSVQLVLMDVQLDGDMDGFAVSKWIRANRSDIRVLLTGTIAKTTKIAGDLCEDGPSLSKPFNHQTLLDHIKRMLKS